MWVLLVCVVLVGISGHNSQELTPLAQRVVTIYRVKKAEVVHDCSSFLILLRILTWLESLFIWRLTVREVIDNLYIRSVLRGRRNKCDDRGKGAIIPEKERSRNWSDL